MQYQDSIKEGIYEIDAVIGVPEEENGNGILFAHGAGASNVYLDGFTKYFNKEGFYTIAPNLVYSGDTKVNGKPRKEMSARDNEEILKISADELVNKGLSVFGAGHSLGSNNLCGVAEDYEDLEKLGLLCPAEVRNVWPIYPLLKLGCKVYQTFDGDFPVRKIMLSPFLNTLDKESRTWLESAAKKYGPELFPETYDPYFSENLLDTKTFGPLNRSKTEALVFLGDADPLGKPLKKYFKDGEKYGNIEIEYFNGGHMAPFFHHKEFSEKMINFFLG